LTVSLLSVGVLRVTLHVWPHHLLLVRVVLLLRTIGVHALLGIGVHSLLSIGVHSLLSIGIHSLLGIRVLALHVRRFLSIGARLSVGTGLSIGVLLGVSLRLIVLRGLVVGLLLGLLSLVCRLSGLGRLGRLTASSSIGHLRLVVVFLGERGVGLVKSGIGSGVARLLLVHVIILFGELSFVHLSKVIVRALVLLVGLFLLSFLNSLEVILLVLGDSIVDQSGNSIQISLSASLALLLLGLLVLLSHELTIVENKLLNVFSLVGLGKFTSILGLEFLLQLQALLLVVDL